MNLFNTKKMAIKDVFYMNYTNPVHTFGKNRLFQHLPIDGIPITNSYYMLQLSILQFFDNFRIV